MFNDSFMRGMERRNMGHPYSRNNNKGQDFGMFNDSSSQSEETSDMPNYNSYRSSTMPSRRYKRERPRSNGRPNSGQRSQYNPNSSQPSMNNGDSQRNDNMSSGESGMNNTSDDGKNKACVVHCFLEDLEMTGDNGMPDKHMVTNVIIKDVKNEDLKDFLQESIDECFQILSNESTQEKCEFAKNLMMCLSEKGRSNCDDWKEDSLHF